MKRFQVELSTAQIAPANSRIQAGIGYVDKAIYSFERGPWNILFLTSTPHPVVLLTAVVSFAYVLRIPLLPPLNRKPQFQRYGTGYDLSNSIFSPDGRNFQVEYAVKAVENGGTSIGIRCKDGVVLAVEKIISSKLLKPGANKRIATVDRHIGIVSSGLLPDGRHFVSRARDEADNWRTTYKGPISTHVLASRLGGYAQAYTLYSSVRPFGVTSIIGGWDSELELPVDGEVGAGPKSGAGGKVASAKAGGPGLYMIEPSGLYWGYYGAATGVKEAARIIYVAHEDSKDKDFELEMTWISAMDGPTKGRHEEVPKALLEEAIREAKQAMEGDDEDDEEEKQGEDEGDKMEE
ncbi:proteasome component [Histoplasma capsulatum H143]|uniref:Proteasome component n=1 Tax=Ajellomyces capsulatus (strain H143) TaxID=544712 RepID=C6HSH1_AJECH|nr:proteasome component [Histoplasma capsulatum H143]